MWAIVLTFCSDLDIQVKEPTPDSLMKKDKAYLPPRFMSVKEGTEQLLELVQSGVAKSTLILSCIQWIALYVKRWICDFVAVLKEETLCIALARIGADDQVVVAGTLAQMVNVDLGPPLHSLVIAASILHPIEEEFIKQFRLESWTRQSYTTNIPPLCSRDLDVLKCRESFFIQYY